MASRVTRSKRQLTQHQEQRSRARWTAFLTKVLVELMMHQVNRGNKKKNFFNKKAWKCICDEFFSKTGLNWDIKQLKNRFLVLRRQYAVVKSLLDLSDFSLDESTGTIVASDEVWAEYIQGHADAETIRSSGCPLYKQLCAIFSEPRSAEELEGGVRSSLHGGTSSESEDGDDMGDDDKDFQPSTPSSTVSQKGVRKRVDDDAIAGPTFKMVYASKLRTSAVYHGNDRYTIANCIKELDGMKGVEKQVYFAALDLFNHTNARETFLSLKGDKRLIWLHRKCNAAPAS
ncbi:hypothetical protein Ddye_010016 [Dipteronia dyeriana]|uniref:Myb/SANT-like domain-containing protein n=1 Tax=Dipteronia dyeriana TaxID=168575 RepID=A0AAE0CMY0_9ROSI|nr:hypothetical protein Ddye_010016 [Dipteronia dyeriana]